MDFTSDFDKKIESLKRAQPDRVEAKNFVVEAAIYVHDTLDLARVTALSAIGGNVSESTVLEVYDRINAERLRLARDSDSEQPDTSSGAVQTKVRTGFGAEKG